LVLLNNYYRQGIVDFPVNIINKTSKEIILDVNHQRFNVMFESDNNLYRINLLPPISCIMKEYVSIEPDKPFQIVLVGAMQIPEGKYTCTIELEQYGDKEVGIGNEEVKSIESYVIANNTFSDIIIDAGEIIKSDDPRLKK
jgi:hypothetical protein